MINNFKQQSQRVGLYCDNNPLENAFKMENILFERK